MENKRSTNWIFVRNNYKNTEFEDKIDCRYIIYGKEVGEQGTPHLQGVICFKNARFFTAMQKLMIGCHIEPCRNLEASIDYCKKDGQWTERGDKPMSRKEQGEKGKEYWDNIIKQIKENKIEEIDSEIKIKHYRTIKLIHQDELKKRKLEDTEEKMLWYFGETGTGKSRKAREENPLAYLKLCNKWWDGYEDQEVVIIEDFDKEHKVLCHHLKIWADRYPFNAEIKGGIIKIRPKLIIVTSNWEPEEIWEDDKDLRPIKRRFKKIKFE